MKDKLIFIGLLLFLLIQINGFSEIPVIDIEIEIIDFEKQNYPTYFGTWQIENKMFFSSPDYAHVLNLETGEWRKFDKEKEIWRIVGEYGEDLFIIRYRIDEQEKFHQDLFIYKPGAEIYNQIPYIKELLIRESYITHYINDKYFINHANQVGGPSNRLYDLSSTNKKILVLAGYYLLDISPDKQHILYGDSRGFFIMNMVTGKEMKIKTGRIDVTHKNPHFISNDIIFLSSIENGYYKITNLKGDVVALFNYYLKEQDTSVVIKKIPHTEYAYYDNKLIRTTGETEALDSLGLLFHPTTGTSNDSRVRIREWPLLDAKHLGYLTKGDKLEILDRSGIKVKIGAMEDYWYKIRRPSDGMEGWSYGAFIDLDKDKVNE